MAIDREVIVERTPGTRLEGMRVSWGGIFGGVLIAVGTLLLLSTLGLAIGISAVNPGETAAGTVGTGSAIWASLTLLVSLFIGGMAATRMSMVWEPTTATYQGALVWVLSMILVLYLAASGIGAVAGAASGLVGGMARTATTAAAAAGASGGMDARALQDLASGNAQQVLQRLNDPATEQNVARVLGVPREQVAATFADVRQRVQAVPQDDPRAVAEAVRSGLQPLTEQARQRMTEAAARAKPQATATAWITFAGLILSALAAILGARAGRRAAADTAIRS